MKNYTKAKNRAEKFSAVVISSVSAFAGWQGGSVYCASKGAVSAAVRSLAIELAPKGIRVNVLAPGFIETDMTGALPENVRQEWEKQIPLRRGGKPEDVAAVAVFLASDLSGYVTGQVINCCGGMNC